MRSKIASSCQLLASSYRLQASKFVTNSLMVVVTSLLLFFCASVNAQASFAPVNINLNYPQYQRLKLDGGYQYIEDAGLQGIILYRLNETTYIAYERLCSAEDAPPVSVDGSGLFMKGCDSTYSFTDGYPTSGSSTRPLMKYRTALTGQILVITDELAY